MQRILIVYNPNSSQYVHIKNDFFAVLPTIKSATIGKFAITKAPFSTNVARLKKILRAGDIVIAAGGDATASVALNAILETEKDITFGALPYGNFNDLARTLGTMKKEDILDFLDSLNVEPKSKALSDACPTIKTLYPLDVIVNGGHWRYASGYVTIGMTATACAIFDEPKFRKSMQKGHKSSWRSYLALAKWYFKNRHKKTFLPDFSVNGVREPRGTSDYAAVNGRSMSRIMKGGDDFLKPQIFRSETEKTTNFIKLCVLMMKSIFSRVPGENTTRDILEFDCPAAVTIQAEGEYQTFKNTRTIEIVKPQKSIKVIFKKGE